MKEEIPFFRHDLGKPELDAIAKVFAGEILTTGKEVADFEVRFADYLNQQHCLGVTSCTGALHLALLALGIGPGDEVITTPATFVATSLAILETGARPVFVDVEPDTGNIDASRVDKAITKKTKAILPVHLYGLMADMKALRDIADKHSLSIVEDAAHCIEGEREGVRPGQLSAAACFSFYATKNITCGEGGALVTKDSLLNEKLRLMRLHGIDKPAGDRHDGEFQHWDMKTFGWKYNMDNIQAAILIPQLSRMESNLQRRQHLAQVYFEKLEEIPGIQFLSTRPETHHARHLFPIRVEAGRRDLVLHALKKYGISAMVNYRAVTLLKYFRETFGYEPGMFPIAEALGNEVLSLPFYPSMPEENVDVVAKSLRRILS